MPDGIVVVPDGADRQAVADTVETIAPAVETLTVVCDGYRRGVTDEGIPVRTITTGVPDGGLVTAMRAGFRATGALTAVVTTPGSPALVPSAAADLEPDGDADVTLAQVDGERHPPLGGYRVSPAVDACDVTLATGSRRLSEVLTRLSVTTTPVSTPTAEPTARAKHET